MVRRGVTFCLWMTLTLAVMPSHARSYIGCGNRSDLTVVIAPHDCFFAWPNLGDAAAIYPRRIHWHGWGGRVALASARWRYRTYEPWTRLRLRAYRRRRCGAGRLYTRVLVEIRTDGRWERFGVRRTPSCREVPGLARRLTELEAGHR